MAIVLLMSLTPSLVMANQSLSQSFSDLNSASVPAEVIKEIKELNSRNIVLKTRPKFCPLNSTRNDVILGSVKNIEAIFKDDCLDNMQGTLDQVLTGADDIQSSINDLRTSNGEEELDSSGAVSDTLAPVTDVTGDLSGQQMASLVNGLNTLFSKNKCSNLDDTSFLENSANIIQNFSQFGLYSPSPTGVTVAYGGLVAGSILKFINNLFEGRFDFEKDEDRMTFIKLNCSFYDVRIKMQEAGIIDISTDQHYKDIARVNALIKVLNDIKSNTSKNSESVIKELENIKKEQLDVVNAEDIKFLTKIKAALVQIENQPGFPVEAQRDSLLDLLTQNYSELVNSLSSYIQPETGMRNSRQNRRLAKMISSLDEVNHSSEVQELEDAKLADLNNYIANLNFHLNRVLVDIDNKKSSLEKNINDMKISLNLENPVTMSFGEILKNSKEGNFKKVNGEVSKLLTELNLLKLRLDSITGKKEFSSQDGGDGADLRILEANDKIVNYLYGDYGKDFVEHMRKKSKKVNDLFKKNFEKFADKNLDVVDGKYRIKPEESLTDDQIDKACVSAKTLRGTWKYGQKWAEMGYDFLSTNKDIFGETGSYLSNDRDKIFDNSQGAILARRIITAMNLTKKAKIQKDSKEVFVTWNGKKLTISDAVELLKDDFKYTMGKSMLDIHKTRAYNGLLQYMYGAYRCDLRANYEK
jgi:hypothetical protein